MRPLFAPAPTDTFSVGFFALLGLVALVTISNGLATVLGTTVSVPVLAKLASTTLLLS